MAGEIGRLLDIMTALRDPETGCPWDLEQDFATIAPFTIEEAYEVADAIEREDMEGLKGELGDLLFQVVFHARMAEEAGAFNFGDVARAIADKMIARHPHVFGEGDGRTAEQQTADWERMKAAERAAKGATGVLDDVPLGLPATTRAEKLQKRAARVGFDWPEVALVADKIAEEARELSHALAAAENAAEKDNEDSVKAARDAIEDEFGDLLFAVVNLGRWLKVDPEKALRRTNAKFVRRFRHIEARLSESGRSPEDAALDEMEAYWVEAKEGERR
ncbi:MAG: nucleoside triphosphate pyrophosphohydrolase [Alphaproteobacteria bacterium]|nr:nucleoside triphosphate pyrophosphohydrolase [Alphaproteobacteria bacterium]